MDKIDKLLKTISEAPISEIPKDVSLEIRKLIGGNHELIADLLQDIFIDCLRKGTCSNFALGIIENTIISARTKD